jgi:magnesium transporter
MLDLKTDTPALRGEDGAIRADFVARVSGAVREADADGLRALVGDLHEADLGAVLETLAPDERPRLIQLLGIDFDFTALTEVDEAVRDEILEGLPPKTVADGVRDLESDDAVAILEGLEHEDRAQILAELPARERIELTRSLDYPEESAGRRMQSDFMAVPAGWNVGRAIDYMRETAELPERFYELFVIDGDGRFLGAVPLARLLRSKRPMPIAELMEQDRPRVRAEQDQEEVARLFQRYNWVAAPVVDANDKLVGVITFDDVADVIEEEAEEDIMALGGVTSDEEMSDSVFKIVRGRFNWLLVNLGAAFISANVLGLFEEQLQKMVALAVLAPIVASQGGNASIQTMTVAVRALATQELFDANAMRVVRREVMVGLFNGIAFAVITGVAAYIWFDVPGLGIVIGLAMMCNLVVAALGGILIPLTFHRLKFDPAVASSPFVTTITDVTGFFVFLSIATLWFGLR